MAGTLVAVFTDNQKAEQAAQALVDEGVPLGDITLVFKGAGGERGSDNEVHGDSKTEEPGAQENDSSTSGVREVETHDIEQPINTVAERAPRAIVGFVAGSALGALFVSVLVFVPGIERLLAQSPLGMMGAGGLLGGLLFAGLGLATSDAIPEDAARAYHEHVQRGDTLVTALASNENHDRLQEILREHGGQRFGYFTRFIDTMQSAES